MNTLKHCDILSDDKRAVPSAVDLKILFFPLKPAADAGWLSCGVIN